MENYPVCSLFIREVDLLIEERLADANNPGPTLAAEMRAKVDRELAFVLRKVDTAALVERVFFFMK